MSPQPSLDGWPLIDPDRDLIGVPRVSGPARSGTQRVCQAHAWVAEQMVAEKVFTRQRAHVVLLPAISAVHAPIEQEMRRRILVAFGCLERIVRIYPHDRELQDFLDVPPTMRQWVLRELPDVLRRIDLCRLDLHGERLGTLRILEFNASNPVGIVYHGLLPRLWRQVPDIADLLDEWKVGTAPFEQRDWFVQRLLAWGATHGVADSEARHIGLFFEPQRHISEQAAMENHIVRVGRTPVLLNPTTAPVPEEIRLGYLKYSPRGMLRDVGRWDDFCTRIVSGQLVIPNPFAGRFVAENKRCLAVMSDPRFHRLFTVPQRRALDALIPWSRKLGDGITIAEAIADQQDLVLKAPYDAGGRAVSLGLEHSRTDWSALLRDPSRLGWLVQRYVPTPRIDTAHGHCYRDLCVWIVNGSIAGYHSRVSQHRRLNVAQGGAVQAVFGHHPPLNLNC